MRVLTRSLPYLAFCAVATVLSARLFLGALLEQTGGHWSAPLDDVFIHFDYARAVAYGYPFQWSPGNGFSTGNTSLTYPFILALGYRLGAQGTSLLVWADTVAATCILGLLWTTRRWFQDLGALAPFSAPVALFSVGALGWSLWSGMEVAWFLGVWALAAALATELVLVPRAGRGWQWALGAAGALLVLTRPEGASSQLMLGLWVAAAFARRRGVFPALGALLRIGSPAVLALLGQSLVNYLLTGQATANGAIVKLALFNPYLSAAEKWDDYLFNLHYSFDRIHFHHLGEPLSSAFWVRPGLVVLLLALTPLLARSTRSLALMLWGSTLGWVLLVAMNGQVRWQNERYLMPAVAWELLLAALGLSLSLRWLLELVSTMIFSWRGSNSMRRLALVGSSVLLGGALLGGLALWWRNNRIQYKDQVWFFARACRNILDQHLRAGHLLTRLDPSPRRVLVGDAGALIYESDLPGYDLIGLGGYHDLPVARASVQGLGASLELLQRIPPGERPDTLAIYPTWWRPLPSWFAHRVTGVTVQGNVICGGAEKVIYDADWRLLNTGARPLSLPPNFPILDEIDVADLVSEDRHRYHFPQPHGGYVDMRVLENPPGSGIEVWDAGRHIPIGRPEYMQLHRLPAGHGVKLILRTTADQPFAITLDAGAFHSRLEQPRALGWIELSIPIPAEDVTQELPLSITPTKGDFMDYHLWVVAN